MTISQITTHVLDATVGRPAEGVPVELAVREASGWVLVGTGATDADGRATGLGPASVAPGEYRLRFDTGAFFAGRGAETFYPEVVVHFEVAEAGRHVHVPLLLSPFAYSTYRGS
ncbi:hydroxyisourate hydrolase [Agromyces cerinus]|uniref:5-hydroxyisourate hydrolase n=1 Tax=Agromyces cerinus subsp. cerinus TaxID=232089 RepID=A0A1N6DD55_9MICO|nr:hydroxyisourate hydrolase [Agromyces cerinus]SIN68731.1 5-hydroxyisourate hydrolase [Agromyces cerinus subsp. cerinus]